MLEAVAARLGIAVRYEAVKTGPSRRQSSGGLCRLRSQPLILIDARLTFPERVAILAEALATFDTDEVPMLPAVRDAIRAKGRTVLLPRPRPLARAKPHRGD